MRADIYTFFQYLLFLCLLVLGSVLLTGCNQSENGGNGGINKFIVRYEATGNFTSKCDIFYITRNSEVSPDEENEGGVSLQEKSSLPWTFSYEVTVTKLRPFNTLVSAVCADNIARSAEVVIFIDDIE